MNYKKRIEEIMLRSPAAGSFSERFAVKKIDIEDLISLFHDFSNELIGEDEEGIMLKESPETEVFLNKIPALEGRNKFRAEQRKKVTKLLGRKHE